MITDFLLVYGLAVLYGATAVGASVALMAAALKIALLLDARNDR